MKIIDLRSDTFTKPSKEMWKMLRSLDNSKIGDDVFGEDPTVNALEEKAAKIIGKEAALYVTSGTQANLVSLLSHTDPRDTIFVEELSHIYQNELISATQIARLEVKTYSSDKGVPDLDKLSDLIENTNTKESPIKCICSENTHNYHGGAIIKPTVLKDLRKVAENYELKLHLDGARIFNAAIGLNEPVTTLTKHVNSVMFCLSKGLSCPVGSLVAGSKNFISKARKYRKLVGGGMRQAGIIASFGLVALKTNWIQRLKEDHRNAKLLANGLKNMDFPIEVNAPDTNIVIIDVPNEFRIGKIVRKLGNAGILIFNIDKHRIRFVTHYGINKEDIEYALEKMQPVLSNLF
ncbi:MAG: aminotransferase class I/II-fold pyridoxal phosphate-dependent enzyme [Candidatus Lokiarchaeota archaeon]|nr:aminotransferase class I/II-fold pyridoxal phosphate-dependent enzyme [Candidatus Lokiarchaeota archaeon]MBD3338149.1 aminotransferase class I/II-fold pyridoxal phosphate-dependent enzyme [Candidatus Lokiarchaeota archaeon]